MISGVYNAKAEECTILGAGGLLKIVPPSKYRLHTVRHSVE